MGPSEGSSASPGIEDGSPQQVVSLCDYRQAQAVARCTKELRKCLEGLHGEAIAVHNEIIDRAQMSVLTEVCRSSGIVLEQVAPQVQAEVLVPAALYGDSGPRIFGKMPLQQSIRRRLGDPAAEAVMDALAQATFRVWEYHPNRDGCGGRAAPIAGQGRGQYEPLGAVITGCDKSAAQAGLYSGWAIEFDGQRCIAFAHRLDGRQSQAVRQVLVAQAPDDGQSMWRRLELRLIQAIADPQGQHQRGAQRPRQALRLPPSRRGLVLAIRRGLWRRFAEPTQGLTIHAHIAALIDDDEARQAFFEEVAQIIETVSLKLGGLAPQSAPVTVEEILAPFYFDSHRRLGPRRPMESRPAGELLVPPPLLTQLGLGPQDSIGQVLEAAANADGQCIKKAIESAWTTYRIEQNLMATYGLGESDHAPPPPQALAFAGRSPVLPNMRVLFDERFERYPLSALELPPAYADEIARGVAAQGADFDDFELADIPGDERKMAHLPGVTRGACNALRQALLKFGLNWRRY